MVQEPSFQPIAAANMPPQNLGAEEAILGGLLLDPDAITRVADLLKPEAFYTNAHREIYRTALALHSQGKPTDITTVTAWLQDNGKLEAAGGQARIAQLVERIISTANIDQYAKLVMDKYLRRQLIKAGNEIIELGFKNEVPLETMLDQAEQRIFGLSQERPQSSLAPTSEVLTKTFNEIESRSLGTAVAGIPCNFYDLDAMTQGFQRSDLIIVAGRPAMGKCLTADAEIVQSDGSMATIESICQQQSRTSLLALSSTWKFQAATPSAYINDGIKPVFRVVTRLGRRIETTWTHPFRTLKGWQPLGELAVGQSIAVPRRIPVFGTSPLPNHHIKLLAYFIGDGGLTASSPLFTNGNPQLQADFAQAAAQFPGVKVQAATPAADWRTPAFRVSSSVAELRQARQTFGSMLREVLQEQRTDGRALAARLQVSPSLVSQWQTGICAPDPERFHRLCQVLGVDAEQFAPQGLETIRWTGKNALTQWLVEQGLWGKSAHEKTVPPGVFRLPKAQLALFLNRLFATDGWATVLASGQSQVGYTSVSEKLVRQLQHLLLRFGIIAALKSRQIKYQDSRRPAWQLDITDAISLQTFVDEIGIFGKEAAVEGVGAAIAQKSYHSNRDLIPLDVWDMLAATKGEESWAALAQRAGLPGSSNIHVGKRRLSRPRLLALAEALDHEGLRSLATSDVYWDDIIAIESVGNKQVYDLTIPDLHNFVANDICVHNTSFVLNLARNIAALHNLPVCVFSLEMSKEQLVYRLLSSEISIESGRLRAGRVRQEEWEVLGHGINQLSQFPIYIDDTPNVSVTEMRSKVRRLQAEHGGKLGLVLIDYLQLMEGSSTDNRTQELAKITRSLKGMARELEVPVMTLSQLSRGVESRTNKRPMMSDLRECVTGDTLVMLSDGRRLPIASLVGTQPHVLAMTEGEKIVPAQSDLVWSVGHKPIFEMKLASGRVLKSTEKHRIYTGTGWQALKDIQIGDRVALARQVEVEANPEIAAKWTDAQIALLGHLVGDGSYLKGQPLRYTTASEANSKIVTDAALAFGVRVNRHAGKGNWHQLVFSGNGHRWKPAGINKWLRDLKIFNQRSHEKHLPSEVFQLSSAQVATLVAHLWATDGTYFTPKTNNTGSRIHFSTSSRGLADDVMALLLRFGIVARLRIITHEKYRSAHVVEISGKAMQMAFLRSIPAVGCKVDDARRLAQYLETIKANPNRDTVPVDVFSKVKSSMQKQRISQRQMAALRGTAYGGSSHFQFSPSREVLLDYATILNDAALTQKATSDLFWDEVVAITPLGEAEVFDLTVPGQSSWLADGIVSHNSGAIEQDADMIIMLYRDEYYNPDSPDRGIAEVIITKHRNGPVGTVKLLFEPQFTRFRNLAGGPQG